MVMRNALSFARNVKLYDCPLLPPSISDLRAFLSLAQTTYETLYRQIALMRQKEDASWIIVNAWGLHNRKDDLSSSWEQNYGENPNSPFNQLFSEADESHPERLRKDIDIVFAAGNQPLLAKPADAAEWISPTRPAYTGPIATAMC